MVLHKTESGEFDWLFISTMKCATNSMYQLLPQIGGQQLWNTSGGFHARPTGRFAKRHFTIVRNPYDRAVSIWASTCLRNNDRYNAASKIRSEGGDPNSFEDFCVTCLADDPWLWTPHGWLFTNQHDWINTFILDELVHIENLKPELERIVGPVPDLPTENKSEHRPWLTHMTQDAVDVINDWAEDDFGLGYDRIDASIGSEVEI